MQHHHPDLLLSDNSLFVVIDIQERLVAAMPNDVAQRTIKQTGRLLTAAAQLDIPVLITEQYPRGLGSTLSQLTEKADSVTVIDKTSFSCAKVDEFMQKLDAMERQQVILSGMESHICILQTALDLKAKGVQVFVVEDAVCSRTQTNNLNAIKRMQQAGIIITSMESVLFEWLADAKHADFKTLSKLVI